MNIFRKQKPYVFRPPLYRPWFRPMLHLLSALYERYSFNIRGLTISGADHLKRLVDDGQSVLVTPNHADHADPSLLVHVGRRYGLEFHFMAAREAFEQGRLRRFVLQHSGAFSIDREGADRAAIRTAMQILRECRYPLVIFPEGEIYHHHEALDFLNEGVATILLRAAEKLPKGKRSYAIPTAIRIRHDSSITETFSSRMDVLERRITWKPRPQRPIVNRIYDLGRALIAIKEEEFMGAAQQGDLVDRIQGLQCYLIEQAEQKCGLRRGTSLIPLRIKVLRHTIRQHLNASSSPPSSTVVEELYDDLERIFVAQQLYSYPGRYLSQHPTTDRIAETLFKLEEDILETKQYPAPRYAQIIFGEPIDVGQFLKQKTISSKTGVQPMTQLLRQAIMELMAQMT